MTKKQEVKILLEKMEDILNTTIDAHLDSDYSSEELLVGCAETVYLYASLVRQGLSDKEIEDVISEINNKPVKTRNTKVTVKKSKTLTTNSNDEGEGQTFH